MRVLAASLIANAIAVADIEAALGAIAPNRMLDEPRKRWRKRRIELPRVDVRRDQSQNAGASEPAIASIAIGVIGGKSLKDARPMQEVVDERIDSDEARADLKP
jgi:hypothetical protein